jgi:peptide alpha-N-acetyltransferase
VGKLDQEELLVAGVPQQAQTGYIGMLAVQSSYRRQGIGKALVKQVLKRMKEMGCKSVTLETEVSNTSAQRLYQDSFGFVREELLVRYYLNFNDAFRLRLWLEEEKKM